MEELKIIRIDHANPPINKGQVHLNDGSLIMFGEGCFFTEQAVITLVSLLNAINSNSNL